LCFKCTAAGVVVAAGVGKSLRFEGAAANVVFGKGTAALEGGADVVVGRFHFKSMAAFGRASGIAVTIRLHFRTMPAGVDFFIAKLQLDGRAPARSFVSCGGSAHKKMMLPFVYEKLASVALCCACAVT